MRNPFAPTPYGWDNPAPDEPDEHEDYRALDVEPIGERLLAAIDALREAVERPATSSSSITIEDLVRGSKIITKVYSGDPLSHEQIDAAIGAHAYAHREADRRAMNSWAATVEELAR